MNIFFAASVDFTSNVGTMSYITFVIVVVLLLLLFFLLFEQ